MCLPDKPSFGFGHNDGNSNGALIFGADYNTSYSGISKFQALHGYVVPCAVCETLLAGVVTIPGESIWCDAICCCWDSLCPVFVAATECPNGFAVEYRGYIMANHYYRQYRGEHVCVDVNAESGQRSVSQGEAQ